MKHAIEPQKAEIMLDMCPAGEHIYEVFRRYSDDSFGLSYITAPSAQEAEDHAVKYSDCVSAVARLIRR